MRRLLLVPLLAATPALAQPTWPEPVLTAFFADADFTQLRPDDELRANWELLLQEDRDLVTTSCENEDPAGLSAESLEQVCEAVDRL